MKRRIDWRFVEFYLRELVSQPAFWLGLFLLAYAYTVLTLNP